LGFLVSVLTAPVTHQDQGLQNYVFFFPLWPLPRFCGPRKSSVPGRVQFVSFTGLMVVSQPLVAHGVGGQDVDDLYEIGMERLTNQAMWFVTNPASGFPFQPSPYLNNFSGSKGT